MAISSNLEVAHHQQVFRNTPSAANNNKQFSSSPLEQDESHSCDNSTSRTSISSSESNTCSSSSMSSSSVPAATEPEPEIKIKKHFRFNELVDVQIIVSLKLSLSVEEIKALWYESDEMREARTKMMYETYNAQIAAGEGTCIESDELTWRGFDAVKGGWCPVEKSSAYTSAVVKHYKFYQDPEGLRKYAERLTKEERQRVHQLALQDMKDAGITRPDTTKITTPPTTRTTTLPQNKRRDGGRRVRPQQQQRRSAIDPTACAPPSAKCTDYKSCCKLEEQQPKWIQKALRKSVRGSIIKTGENLELPVTKIQDVAVNKGLVSVQPQWVDTNKILRPSIRGSMIKTGENLELPVTKIDQVAKAKGLGWTKPQWAVPTTTPKKSKRPQHFPSNDSRSSSSPKCSTTNSSGKKMMMMKKKKSISSSAKKEENDENISNHHQNPAETRQPSSSSPNNSCTRTR